MHSVKKSLSNTLYQGAGAVVLPCIAATANPTPCLELVPKAQMPNTTKLTNNRASNIEVEAKKIGMIKSNKVTRAASDTT
jgi:hypothetical protein